MATGYCALSVVAGILRACGTPPPKGSRWCTLEVVHLSGLERWQPYAPGFVDLKLGQMGVLGPIWLSCERLATGFQVLNPPDSHLVTQPAPSAAPTTTAPAPITLQNGEHVYEYALLAIILLCSFSISAPSSL